MSDHLNEVEPKKGQISIDLWKSLLCRVASYRRPLSWLAAAGSLLAFCEIFLPIVTGRVIDEATKYGLTNVLYAYVLLYVVLLVTIAGCVWVFISRAGIVATGVAYDLRKAGFAQLQALSFSYYDVRSTGWLVTRLTSDCSKLSSLLPWFLLDFVWGFFLVTGSIIAMFIIDWRLAIAVTSIVPPLVLVSLYFQKKLLNSSRKIRHTNSLITASYNESVMGVLTTKSLVREDENFLEFQSLSVDMNQYSMRNALQSAVYLPLIASLGSVGVGLALWQGGGGVILGSGLTLGILVTFMQFAALLSMPIQELSTRFTEFQSAQAAAERVQELLDTVPEIQDSDEVSEVMRLNQHQTDSSSKFVADGHEREIEVIRFEDVSFGYKENELVLRDFCLDVKRGETIALVGATGSGKSTIVSLLARFYEPTDGRILLNDVDYRERGLHWFQSQLGVVLQTPHLFSGTIKENIRYGRLDASDEQLEEAARQVGAYPFIASLADGYDTEVGEEGTRLSVGQRQLLSLARAVLADPQIFIMDEATSSVDTETELLIQAGIETLLQGRISFVIAHRLSTIRNADKILVIDKGETIEQGSHIELMKQRGHYYGLYTHQFVRDVAEVVQPSTISQPG